MCVDVLRSNNRLGKDDVVKLAAAVSGLPALQQWDLDLDDEVLGGLDGQREELFGVLPPHIQRLERKDGRWE